MKKVFVVFLFILGIGLILFFMKSERIHEKEMNVVTLKIEEEVTDVKEKVTSLTREADSETLDEMAGFIKEKKAEGKLKSKEGIMEVIDEAEDKFGTTVSDDTRQQIASAITQLEDMGFSTDTIVNKTEELYDRYGTEFGEHIEEVFLEAAKEKAADTVQSAWDGVKETFKETVNNIGIK